MQKIFCNLCGKEIKEGTFPGGMMRQVEIFPLQQIPQFFPQSSMRISQNKKRIPQIVERKVEPEIWDLCERCQKEMWVEAEKKQESLLDQKSNLVLISNLVKPTSFLSNENNIITSNKSSSSA